MTAISINNIERLMHAYFADKDSTMLWGPPGIGKSDIIRKIAGVTTFRIPENPVIAAVSKFLAGLYGSTVTGRTIYDVRLLLCQPTDLKGIPVFNTITKRGEWISTGLFPMSTEDLKGMESTLLRHYNEYNDDETEVARKYELKGLIDELEPMIEKGLKDQFSIVFLDEISVAPKMVQAAALQLVLDRSVGTYKLPAGVDIVAAGNRSSDKSGATAMSPPLASRFAHLDAAAPTLDEWLENYAYPNDMPTPIIGFLKFKPGLLFQYDASKLTGAADAPSTFPCPRTWAKFGSLIKRGDVMNGEKFSTTDLQTFCASIVGDGAAAEFVAWTKIYNKLPDPNEILDGRMKSIDFVKLSRNNDQESERDVKSRSLSLRFAFFYALANIYTKKITEYVATCDELRSSNPGGIAKVKEAFQKMSVNFFKFVNADEDDIEYGMVIVNNFLLKEKASLRVIGELRSLPDPDAKSNLDRILKVLDKYKDKGR